ncbi:hypothetical protein [Ketobacter sp.]|uniref:hypothetical protein n=1 Tax=Ketobacter sp. TaxID=2083498 RepID=UPI0025BC3B0B|nr:hypothetical protein [Ketobacter sp.]
MDSFDECKTVTLDDGKTIELNATELSINLIFNGNVIDSHTLGYPSAGFGGGSIHLSPTKTKLVFAYYSGQSEEAFSIFEIGNQLKALYESEYFFGEAASYCFSPNETTFVQAIPRSCTEWWLPWEDGDIEDDELCKGYFEFCEINILDLKNLKLNNCVVRLVPDANWKPPEKAGDPFLHEKMPSEETLEIGFPWGKKVLALPLPKVVIYELSNA